MKSLFQLHLPKTVARTDPVSAADHNLIIDALKKIIAEIRSISPKSSADIIAKKQIDGSVYKLRRRSNSGSTTATCPFGEIIPIPDSDPPTYGIKGGMVYCGDKTFTVPPYEIDMTAAGVWLAFMRIECESNRDDDEEIFLPGIKTSGDTVDTFWDKLAWTAGPPPTQYEDNVNPFITTGLGTIIIPAGKFSVVAGVGDAPNTLTFEPVACGDITINQCGGTIGFSRA